MKDNNKIAQAHQQRQSQLFLAPSSPLMLQVNQRLHKWALVGHRKGLQGIRKQRVFVHVGRGFVDHHLTTHVVDKLMPLL